MLPSAVLALFTSASLFHLGAAIYCYQCNSNDLKDPFQCQEMFPEDSDIAPQSCDDVYNAAYCIKHVGRFEGWAGHAILCYQCFAPNNTECSDMLIQDKQRNTLRPTNCSHIFEASYCIKTTNMYAGGVGTRRFCSSVDMGNYCDYIKQPGDKLEYRSCVYTCSSDGCNPASTRLPSSLITLLVTALSLLFYFTSR